MNPDDYIITRKRKKYRFALFANSELCFEYDEWDHSWHPDVVEIGAGTGESLVELAERHPDKKYVALDVKGDRLQKGARLAEAHKLVNIRFLRAHADQLLELFQPESFSEIWLTFSDPFPRRGSAGRRLTNPHFLRYYAQLLAPSGSLIVKHDNEAFFQWTLEQLVAEKWHIDALSFDLHESDLPDDYKIMTTYESRWIREGRITRFVSASMPNDHQHNAPSTPQKQTRY